MHDESTTPGQLLTRLLLTRGWNNRAFAGVIGVDEGTASRLVGDKKPINAVLALKLEQVFEVPAEEFLRLQAAYDLAVARLKQRPDPEAAQRQLIYGELPLSAMIKRGWLNAPSVRDRPAVNAALTQFFGVETPEQIELLPHAAKRSEVGASATLTQLAWLYRVKRLATEMVAPAYSEAKGRAVIERLSSLLASAEEVRKVPRVLAEHGIRFVIVETLPSAKIDGVCLWLSDTAPVIGMSVRFDRIDNFWFVLRHELEHVLRGDGKGEAVVDADLDGLAGGVGNDVAEEERVANLAAAEFLVPKAKMDAFVARKAPFFHRDDIVGFARTLKVHPGLVAGQLQRRIGKYNLFRDHLVKVRSIVMPGAIVDGWGNIAPISE
jgi:HTH-type transcriptional regulator/antitoxin HigA